MPDIYLDTSHFWDTPNERFGSFPIREATAVPTRRRNINFADLFVSGEDGIQVQFAIHRSPPQSAISGWILPVPNHRVVRRWIALRRQLQQLLVALLRVQQPFGVLWCHRIRLFVRFLPGILLRLCLPCILLLILVRLALLPSLLLLALLLLVLLPLALGLGRILVLCLLLLLLLLLRLVLLVLLILLILLLVLLVLLVLRLLLLLQQFLQLLQLDAVGIQFQAVLGFSQRSGNVVGNI